MAETSDKELVKKCLLGNRNSFDTLVKRYQATMYRTAFNIVKDAETASDVTQNGFIKCWENLHSFDNDYKFYSWLYRIVINESLNHIRDNRDFEALSSIHTDGRTPYHQIMQKEENHKLYKAIDSLGDDYRIVIYLRHFEELSYREIAEILEINEKTVKSRLYTARLRLRELLFDR